MDGPIIGEGGGGEYVGDGFGIAMSNGMVGESVYSMDDGMVLKEEDDEDVVLVDDDLEGALGGGRDFGVHWEGGVVTSSSLVRSTKRGFDGGLTVILGF